MRETMNNLIEDEKGLMKTSEFKRMIFTAYGGKNKDKTEIIYSLLQPIIDVHVEGDDESYVSISKLSMFIDFFNYFPFKMGSVKSKNSSSKDMALFMGNQ